MQYFHIQTWGCQMNHSDSEKIKHVLEGLGYEETDRMESADLIILNSCSVRQRAEDKVLGLGRIIRKLKEKDPGVAVVLTGCMAQRVSRVGREEVIDTKYVRQLRRRMPWVDAVVEIGDLAKLASVVSDVSIHEQYLNASQSDFSDITANVPISKGCDNFCSYCIVPYTRGKEVHRSYSDIYRHVSNLVEDKFRMITLLGQNVNSWKGEYKSRTVRFPFLLEKMAQIDGDFWLTFLTSHPKDFDEDLIDAIAENERICRYVNLPVQSGSDKVLKLMNRHYTIDDYRRKIDVLRKKVPDVRLSTDIIVGFPGETERDFDATLKLVEDLRFGMVYIAEYSPRRGAASATMEDSVPKEEKCKRRKALDSLLRDMMEEQHTSMHGTIEEVLVLGDTYGKTSQLIDVKFEELVVDRIGEFVDVEVTGSTAGGLVGKLAV